jgi:hypothetical protein
MMPHQALPRMAGGQRSQVHRRDAKYAEAGAKEPERIAAANYAEYAESCILRLQERLAGFARLSPIALRRAAIRELSVGCNITGYEFNYEHNRNEALQEPRVELRA